MVACNTASALAVPRMKELFKVPVQGVVTSVLKPLCAPLAIAASVSDRNARNDQRSL